MSTRAPAARLVRGLLPGNSSAALLLVRAGGNFQRRSVGAEQDALNLRRIEGTRAHATGDRDLVPGLVNVTVTALPARDRHGFSTAGVSCDQFRLRVRSGS